MKNKGGINKSTPCSTLRRIRVNGKVLRFTKKFFGRSVNTFLND